MTRVLGISASLRNARFGIGKDVLAAELGDVESRDDLLKYLECHTRFRLEDFLEAGRADGRPFDKIYAGLRKLRGERGLSNSEAALAAALWAAHKEGSEIEHRSLARHFPMNGEGRDLDDLKHAIESADAIILSGPVYFGDRGSLAQSFIEFIAGDEGLKRACRGKIYAGIAVGAKRNGGQETTLIYQMLDMINLDFLAVGNSSDTTSQYGGTAVAGDVGKAHTDEYGIDTSIGTGRRAARVSQLLARGRSSDVRMKDKLKLQLWLLQDDAQRTGLGLFNEWAHRMTAGREDLDVQIMDAAGSEVVRCIACDICPTHVGAREDYRCIITSAEDFFVRNHAALIEADAVLLCAYSPKDRVGILSMYQQFIERTRYLRRDNYVFSDLLMAPFVISELAARQNLHLRMLTSAIRHHTVMHHPIIGMVHDGELLNGELLLASGQHFVTTARTLAVGRYLVGHRQDLLYNPIGYEISAQKAHEDRTSGRTASALAKMTKSTAIAAKERIDGTDITRRT